jgi:hypothetical protein
MPLPRLYYASPRGQCAVILFAALRDLYVTDGFRCVTKRQAIEFIRRNHWFALEEEDNEPYPSQNLGFGEPRWHTLIAWARKDTVIADMVSYEARDSWGLTRRGREVIDCFHELCRDGKRPVGPCFLWSKDFKSFMQGNYEASQADAKRPRSFYRDIRAELEIY